MKHHRRRRLAHLWASEGFQEKGIIQASAPKITAATGESPLAFFCDSPRSWPVIPQLPQKLRKDRFGEITTLDVTA
jgi:hypothetical protein